MRAATNDSVANASTRKTPLSLAGRTPPAGIPRSRAMVRFVTMGMTESGTGDDRKTDAIAPDGHPTKYVVVGDLRSADSQDTCLRPLGLCELGGSCDSCWYRPDHPRFQNR